MGCVPPSILHKEQQTGYMGVKQEEHAMPRGLCFSYRQEMLLCAVVCCCLLEGKGILGDGLGSLFRQLPDSSSDPPAQLQLAQKLAHPPQLLAGVTWGGRVWGGAGPHILRPCSQTVPD